MTELEVTEERLLTTREASAATGYHATHFNAVILSKQLPATKDEKGRWQIKQSDLDEYLASKSVKPRRAKPYIKAESDKPEKSLLTQLDEKEKEVKNLQFELAASGRAIDDLKTQHSQKVDDLQVAISQAEERLQRAKNRIERLKEENNDLRIENLDHIKFMRETLTDLLQYVTK